ncbi:MAG: ferritin family protein [Geobacter sp.]|nr:ferritin family protein [Geobacter sp.]
MNIFDYAIRIESEGNQLFQRLGHETTNNELKRIYGLLASAEQEHIGTLEAMKREIDPNDAESSLVERAWQVKSGFRKLLESSDVLHELKDDPDGFWHIVKAEEENIKLLEGMAAAELKDEARVLLSKIADDEKKHLEIIEGIYEFIETPHTYLEWGEFSNLHPL